MFYLLGWIFFGLIVGVIAKLFMPGRPRQGLAPARKNLHTQNHSKLLAEVKV